MTSKSEPVDIIEQDPYDPAIVALYEEQLQEIAKTAPDGAAEMIKRRKEAYSRVFTPGERTQADIDIVLADLMWFCKVRVPTYDIRDGEHAEALAKRKEGRREVFHRIEDFSRLSHDALFLMYTNAITS